VPELEPLRADHADAVLAFERDNRAWFAESVSDRGEEFFTHFAEVHAARLAEPRAGLGAYYLLVEDGAVLGRVNLTLDGDVATLGYRLARAATGRGLATTAVVELCAVAAQRHGTARVVAATSTENVASQRVLARAGFTLVGPARPDEVGGRTGYRYERVL
jgi:[ribosomal protein S5]-alanine N-acetyltransferase